MDIQRQAFQEWYIANHHDGDIHPNQQLLEWSEKGGFYFASSVEDLWEAWQAAKAQAVPEGFVVVSQKDLLELTIAINAVDLATHTESKTNEVREMWQQVALKLMALGISQEPAND